MWLDPQRRVAQLTNGDQHCYLVACPTSREALVVDPGVPSFLDQVRPLGVKVKAVLNTHGHHDHTGGNGAFVEAYGAKVCRFGGGDQPLAEGGELWIGSIRGRVMHTPGHTPDSICLRLDDFLFCGDALFIASCGNAFGEQSMHAMYETLKRVNAVPEETILCCGHDYALKSLRYVLDIEPENAAAAGKLAAIEAAHRECRPVFSTLAQERSYNPFFRLETEEMARFLLQQQGECPDEPWGRFQLLRELKNRG